MTESSTQHSGGGLVDALKNNPAVSHLGEAAKDYAKARGGDVVRTVAGKLSNVTESMNEKADNGGFKGPAISTALQKVSEGESPVKAAVSGVGTGIKEKVKSAFGRSGRSQKFMNIIEDVTVGVPVDVAYNQWTQFQEFASFMKGVDSVDQTDEVTSNWKVKVFKSRRTWKGTVQEQIPDRKIAWTTDGPKGTTKGVVTFHPLADDLTQILLVIEYYPSGLFEKTGNLWRAPGRRARLDLKNFRRFITMRGEETGSWRGEIRDGQVVRGPDEEGEESEEQPDTGQDQAEQGGEEDQYEEDEYGDDEEDEEEGDQEEGDQDQDEYEDAEDYEDEDYEGEEEPEEEPDEEPEEAPNGRPARRREPAGAGGRRR
jgi:uncharacterized membrane protein